MTVTCFKLQLRESNFLGLEKLQNQKVQRKLSLRCIVTEKDHATF